MGFNIKVNIKPLRSKSCTNYTYKKRNSYTTYTAIKKEARARGSGLSIIPITTNYPSFKDRLVLSIVKLIVCPCF